ncbi:MBL fold metallo-hydrolase [Oceanospirillum sanctuarii]|uniref:MBL fold metallo-hydrolase n=1 Tax=Oceanospirillum sanctuarii TaxID=1434821 RepID=UPI000A374DAC|nr:MBL fold metallo-hydrolase [Oceanospirillum sanctuarii]
MPIRKRYSYTDDQGFHVEGARVGRLNLGINTSFILYRLGDTLIDTGPSNQWPESKHFMEEAPISRILLSHHHEDHSGNAANAAELLGVTPFAPTQATNKFSQGYKTPLMQRVIWGDPKPVRTQPLPEIITLDGFGELQAIHTPGHAKDLHCFYLPQRRWLFSGDLYISKSLRMMREDENLTEILYSMQKVLELDFQVIFCPHRGILEQGKQAMQEKLSNMLNLCQQVQQLRKEGLKEKAISNKLLGKEELACYLSGYNFSKINLIRQALKVDLSEFTAVPLS